MQLLLPYTYLIIPRTHILRFGKKKNKFNISEKLIIIFELSYYDSRLETKFMCTSTSEDNTKYNYVTYTGAAPEIF